MNSRFIKSWESCVLEILVCLVFVCRFFFYFPFSRSFLSHYFIPTDLKLHSEARGEIIWLKFHCKNKDFVLLFHGEELRIYQTSGKNKYLMIANSSNSIFVINTYIYILYLYIHIIYYYMLYITYYLNTIQKNKNIKLLEFIMFKKTILSNFLIASFLSNMYMYIICIVCIVCI